MLNNLVDTNCDLEPIELRTLKEQLANINCNCSYCNLKNKYNKNILKDEEIQVNKDVLDKHTQVDKKNVRLCESTEVELSTSDISDTLKPTIYNTQNKILCPNCCNTFDEIEFYKAKNKSYIKEYPEAETIWHCNNDHVSEKSYSVSDDDNVIDIESTVSNSYSQYHFDTQHLLSAKGRNLNSPPYLSIESYIQTIRPPI